MSRQHHKFKTFIRNHRDLLSIVGLLIVFVTFIVKEGLADHWKDQASAIDMGEYIYAIRADTSKTVASLDSMSVHSFENKVIFEKHNGPETLYESDWQDLDTYLGEAERMMVSLRNIEILIDKLPKQESFRKELEQFKKSQLSFYEGFGVLKTTLAAAGEGPHHFPLTAQEQVELSASKSKAASEVQDSEIELGNKFAFASRDADWFILRVLKQAEIVRKKNERYSKFAWWIAAVLYSCGWGLGVVARLFHVPAVATSD